MVGCMAEPTQSHVQLLSHGVPPRRWRRSDDPAILDRPRPDVHGGDAETNGRMLTIAMPSASMTNALITCDEIPN